MKKERVSKMMTIVIVGAISFMAGMILCAVLASAKLSDLESENAFLTRKLYNQRAKEEDNHE
jgi:hypothetical protein